MAFLEIVMSCQVIRILYKTFPQILGTLLLEYSKVLGSLHVTRRRAIESVCCFRRRRTLRHNSCGHLIVRPRNVHKSSLHERRPWIDFLVVLHLISSVGIAGHWVWESLPLVLFGQCVFKFFYFFLEKFPEVMFEIFFNSGLDFSRIFVFLTRFYRRFKLKQCGLMLLIRTFVRHVLKVDPPDRGRWRPLFANRKRTVFTEKVRQWGNYFHLRLRAISDYPCYLIFHLIVHCVLPFLLAFLFFVSIRVWHFRILFLPIRLLRLN